MNYPLNDITIFGAEERNGAEPEHAVYGASSMAIWSSCPGMFNLLRRAQKSGAVSTADHGSRYAAEGTAAHDEGERLLTDAIKRNFSYGSPEGAAQHVQPPEDCDDPAEFKRAVGTYVHACLSAAETAPPSTRTPFFVGVELRVELNGLYEMEDWQLPEDKPADWLAEHAPLFGTADFVLAKSGILYVVDYKHGSGVPVSPDSPQLRYYALGAYLRLRREKPEAAEGIHTVETVVVQPRAPGDAPEGIKRATWSMSELRAFGSELVGNVLATFEDDAPLNPGKHCQFCRAAAAPCPGLAKRARDLAKQHFGVIDGTDQINTDTSLDLTGLEPETLAQYLSELPVLKDFIRKVEVAATSRLGRGEAVPGWKPVRGRAHRRWRDEEAVLKDIETAVPNAADKAAPRKPLTVAQMEKLAKQDGQIDALMNNALQAHIEKPEGKITYAPEDDARPAVTSAQASFSPLDTEGAEG